MDISKRIAWSDWNMLIFITLIYFFANMQKVLVPGATFDEIQQLFDVDASAVSNTGAIFLCVYAISQLAVGVMADRFGGAKVIVWGGLIFCIGSVLSGVPGSFMLLCVSRFLTGLGAAAIYLSMIKEIARISGSALPLFLGIAMIVGYSGAIAGASPFIAGVKHLGYSKMMLITGGVTAVVYAGFLLSALKNQFPAVRKEVTFSISSYLNVFKRRHNIALLAVCGLNFGVYFALQSIIGKKFLQDFCSMSETASGAVLTVTMLIAAFNGFILANLSRWAGNRRKIFLQCGSLECLVGAGLIVGALIFDIRQPVWAVTGMILLAFGGNVTPIFVSLVKETNEENRFGTVLCVGNFFSYSVTAGFGCVLGKLMDIYPPQKIDGISVYSRNSYLLVFAVLIPLLAISMFCALKLRESYGKDIDVR